MWQRRRERILKRDVVCVFCGSDKGLQVHHLDHDPHNNLDSNLLTLCSRCHALEHRG